MVTLVNDRIGNLQYRIRMAGSSWSLLRTYGLLQLYYDGSYHLSFPFHFCIDVEKI